MLSESKIIALGSSTRPILYLGLALEALKLAGSLVKKEAVGESFEISDHSATESPMLHTFAKLSRFI